MSSLSVLFTLCCAKLQKPLHAFLSSHDLECVDESDLVSDIFWMFRTLDDYADAVADLSSEVISRFRAKRALYFDSAPLPEDFNSPTACTMQFAHALELVAFTARFILKDERLSEEILTLVAREFDKEYSSMQTPENRETDDFWNDFEPTMALLLRAEQAYKNKNFILAVSLYTWANAHGVLPSSALLYNRSMSYLAMGYPANAQDDIETAILLNEHVAQFHSLLTKIHIRGKHYPEALSACQRGLSVAPKDQELMTLRRQCFIELKIPLEEIAEEAELNKGDETKEKAREKEPSTPEEIEEARKAKQIEGDNKVDSTAPLLFMLNVSAKDIQRSLNELRLIAKDYSHAWAMFYVALFLAGCGDNVPQGTDKEARGLATQAYSLSRNGHMALFLIKLIAYDFGSSSSQITPEENVIAEVLPILEVVRTSPDITNVVARIPSKSEVCSWAHKGVVLHHWEQNRMMDYDGLPISARLERMKRCYVPSARLERIQSIIRQYTSDKKNMDEDPILKSVMPSLPDMVKAYEGGSITAGDCLHAEYLAFFACNEINSGRPQSAFAAVRKARRVCDSVLLPLGPLCAAFDSEFKQRPQDPDLLFFRALFSTELSPADREKICERIESTDLDSADIRAMRSAFLGLTGAQIRALEEAEFAAAHDPSVPAYAFAVPAAREALAGTDEVSLKCIEEFKKFLSSVPKDDRRVPDAEFAISRIMLGLKKSSAETLTEAKKHFQLAQEAIKNRLPFFPPVAPAPALQKIIDAL